MRKEEVGSRICSQETIEIAEVVFENDRFLLLRRMIAQRFRARMVVVNSFQDSSELHFTIEFPEVFSFGFSRSEAMLPISYLRDIYKTSVIIA